MTNGGFARISALILILSCSAPALSFGPAEGRAGQALVRIQQIDPAVNSVLAVNPDAIRQAQAVDSMGLSGPLAGQPILIKDNIEVSGMPTTAGSLALANNDTRRDAPIVTRLRAAGAIIDNSSTGSAGSRYGRRAADVRPAPITNAGRRA